MANSKLIVIEGAQGAGKTTITDFLRSAVPYTNLYRLSGTSDTSIEGLKKSKNMYKSLLKYTKELENKQINLLFDRTFFSEENYCRLGFKDYSFTNVYNELLKDFANLDFDIYYITVYLKDENLFSERLKRDGKCEPSYAKFKAENSINQQHVYLQMCDEIKSAYPNIHTLKLDNTSNFENTKKTLKEFIKF